MFELNTVWRNRLKWMRTCVVDIQLKPGYDGPWTMEALFSQFCLTHHTRTRTRTHLCTCLCSGMCIFVRACVRVGLRMRA